MTDADRKTFVSLLSELQAREMYEELRRELRGPGLWPRPNPKRGSWPSQAPRRRRVSAEG